MNKKSTAHRIAANEPLRLCYALVLSVWYVARKLSDDISLEANFKARARAYSVIISI